jgi:Reverse transcriptase (RNA-dependent DNA polymerase)
LNAPCGEKIWFEGGIECGGDRGKVLVLVRALYGLKSAGASWRAVLAKVLADLGFESTKADPDVWICPAEGPDGFKYYKMLFVYVDDILAVSHKGKEVLEEIGAFYRFKEGSLKKPEIGSGDTVEVGQCLYLGANVSKFQLPDGQMAWSTSPCD